MASPLLMMLVKVLQTYDDAYQQGGEEAGVQALISQGHTEEQARNFAPMYARIKANNPSPAMESEMDDLRRRAGIA